MYTEYYRLSGRPFQLSPDHRFYFASRSHNRALAYLSYGLNEREGFIVITGDIGAGKTTLVGHLLTQIDSQRFVVANVVTSQLGADDALKMVASAFGLPFIGQDKATILRTIEKFLIDNRREGKHVLLVVDEVQNMSFPALEEMRMLSNFQLEGRPLFQCFLLGQPQFRRIIASEQLDQLRQRVIASCHLEPLDADEVQSYIVHRLTRVGWQNDPRLSDEAFRTIHRHTGGVPRRINTLCSRLLLFGALEEIHDIDQGVVEDVVRELAEEGTQTALRPQQPAPHSPPPVAAPSQAQTPVLEASRTYVDILDQLSQRVAALRRTG